MNDHEPSADVVDNADESRFEITVDGKPAGIARYVRRAGRLILVHTEVDDAYEGQGLGSQLARRALDAARSANTPVVPLCPFIARFIERHDEYEELVDHDALLALS